MRGKVLVVDDERINVALLSALVGTIDGLEPIGFTDPAEALGWCDANTPVLVLVDYAMPGLRGDEFVTRLRATAEGAIVPIVIVTASADRAILLDAFAAGATDFLRKPVEEVEAIARIRSLSQLGIASRRLMSLVATDELTGLDTRRRFMSRLEEEMVRSRRHGSAISVVMMDVDHFKRINDEGGHAAGDAVLREVADRVRATVRDSDFVGRIGGEEFAWALPSSCLDQATAAAERLRMRIEALPFMGGRMVTASFGVAQASVRCTAGDLLRLADERFYAAKNSGRNKVVAAS
ncbi:diguanylate cyclase [Sphingomonas sp. A2-49]|uniref:diguanylate cyclase n=1 Tax=Sphingomonas sp. A2-49 TaxID=1391375 RepID=UPI0021D3D291|nr:diguanylate cyclase [Sphingomonas sp. A2-49]MCU6456144.1 diguanylate cyclase [Sphingomonas sp. A2-49]